jgi:hypothetical protein
VKKDSKIKVRNHHKEKAKEKAKEKELPKA